MQLWNKKPNENETVIKHELEKGNVVEIDENTKVELLNIDEFIKPLIANASQVSVSHFRTTLNMKLIVDGKEFKVESTFDSYHGTTTVIDENAPIKVELKTTKVLTENSIYLKVTK